MYWRLMAALAAGLAVANCGGNPLGNEADCRPNPLAPETNCPPVGDRDDAGETDPTDFSPVTNDLRKFSFTNGVLTIDMEGVFASGDLGEFYRLPAMDVLGATPRTPSYLAYVSQETALTRSYLAYVATNTRGSIVSTASADGGQFNERNGGGRWMRLTSYTRPEVATGTTGTPGPERGTFSYAGTYAGVFVPGPAAAGNPRPPNLQPGEPWGVDGTIQINAQFESVATGEVVEGGIVNRRLLDRDGNVINTINIDGTIIGDDEELLADIVLRETAVDADGQFLGDVEFAGVPDTPIGDYGGAFAGSGASDVAGVLLINPISGQNGIWEFGTFNLPRCDLAGSAPLCAPR